MIQIKLKVNFSQCNQGLNNHQRTKMVFIKEIHNLRIEKPKMVLLVRVENRKTWLGHKTWELLYQKKFLLQITSKLFNQDKLPKSLITVLLNLLLQLRLDTHLKIPIRWTKILSLFCHILESIEEHISFQYVMVMVWMVN